MQLPGAQTNTGPISATAFYGDGGALTNISQASIVGGLTFIDTSTGAVTHVLSGTGNLLLVKTNALYNLLVVAGTTTNTIGGDGVWVEAKPTGTTWLLRW